MKTLTVLAVTALVLQPSILQACSVCFGKSDDALAKGMNMGIFALLGFVVVMWIAVGSFFVFLARRSSAVGKKAPSDQPANFVSQQ